MADDLLRGIGVLIINEQRHDNANYQIAFTPVGESNIRMTGVLSLGASNAITLTAAFMSKDAHLELGTGHVLQIVGTRLRVTDNPPSLAFEAAGPIPTYRA